MSAAKHTAVVIPAYKPDDRLPPYVDALKAAGVGSIVIVDDGSGKDYQPLFAKIPQDDVVHIISYEPNAGKGVALKRGMQYVLDHCPQQLYVLTADSDGQHTVKDVLRMAESMAENSDGVLLGSRDFSQPDVPFKSRNGNRITSTVFKLLYGIWVSDTQTGLRGFARELLPLMIAVKGDRYEYEMNVLIECAHRKIAMRPLTIQTVYENNNEGSHFRAVRDSARIYSVILAGFFRFIGASLLSFVVDYLLFLLFNNVLLTFVGNTVVRASAAVIAARLLSGVFNYCMNRKFVFRDDSSAKKSGPRYLAVFFLIMVLSAALTSGLHGLFGFNENIIKIPVDILLFFCSYTLQQRWVFSRG